MAALDARPKEWWPFYSDAFDAVTLIFLSASLTKNNHNTRSLQPPCGASASMGSDATIYTRKLCLMSCTFSADLLRKWFRLHSVGQCVVPIERSDSPTNNNILLCRISSFILVGIFFFWLFGDHISWSYHHHHHRHPDEVRRWDREKKKRPPKKGKSFENFHFSPTSGE